MRSFLLGVAMMGAVWTAVGTYDELNRRISYLEGYVRVMLELQR